jgi:hypothetical protein
MAEEEQVGLYPPAILNIPAVTVVRQTQVTIII